MENTWFSARPMVLNFQGRFILLIPIPRICRLLAPKLHRQSSDLESAILIDHSTKRYNQQLPQPRETLIRQTHKRSLKSIWTSFSAQVKAKEEHWALLLRIMKHFHKLLKLQVNSSIARLIEVPKRIHWQELHLIMALKLRIIEDHLMVKICTISCSRQDLH